MNNHVKSLVTALVLITFYSQTNAGTHQLNLTAAEIKDLTMLGCKPTAYQMSNGQLQFGDTQSDKTTTALYLVKNTTTNQVVVDYPEAHVGASAWVTQVLSPMQWTGYYYFSDKNVLNTNNGPSKPVWHCNAQNPKTRKYTDNDNQSYCNQYLYVCKVTQANKSGTALQKNAAEVTTKADHSWWVVGASINDNNSVKTIADVLSK
jgi:hypothetical protein